MIPAPDLSQGRDYTYVTDIADGIRAEVEAPALPHDLYNITTGVWLTFGEILEQIRGLSPNIQVIEPSWSRGDRPVAPASNRELPTGTGTSLTRCPALADSGRYSGVAGQSAPITRERPQPDLSPRAP